MVGQRVYLNLFYNYAHDVILSNSLGGGYGWNAWTSNKVLLFSTSVVVVAANDHC